MTSAANELDFYDHNLPLLERLLEEAKFILDAEIDFKFHSVPGRVKERDSVQNKIADRQYTDPAIEMTDLVGLRIVSLFESDLTKADAAVRRAFEVITTENKIEDADDDTFGYMSVHYICSLKEEYQGHRYRDLHSFKFEVQSRTILMDAWANVSHYLAYKGKHSIPDDKKKAFYALAGLFYVADQQFEQLLTGSVRSAANLIPAPPIPEEEQPLDRDNVGAMLDSMFSGRDSETTGERKLAALSIFVDELMAAGIDTVGELRGMLEKGKDAAITFDARLTENEKTFRYSQVGIARLAVTMASPAFAEERKKRSAARRQKTAKVVTKNAR